MKPVLMKRRLSQTILWISIALCLSSCVSERIRPDPVYQKEFFSIEDTAYPADKIVGVWMQVGGDKVMETRTYFLLKKDGTGAKRNVTKKTGEHKPLISECPLKWSNLGRNRWQICIFSGSGYIESNPSWAQATLRSGMVRTVVRFHQDRLYPEECPNTYVRAEIGAVKQQLHSIRSVFAE